MSLSKSNKGGMIKDRHSVPLWEKRCGKGGPDFTLGIVTWMVKGESWLWAQMSDSATVARECREHNDLLWVSRGC